MFRLKLMVLLTLTLVGCGEPVDLVLPSSAEIEAHYLYEGHLGESRGQLPLPVHRFELHSVAPGVVN